MTVARSTGVLLGTDETTGVSIANNATTTSSEVDMFGNNTSEGWVDLYLKFTSPGASVGTMDVKTWPGRVTGQDYSDQAAVIASWATVASTTQKIFLGQFQVGRFMQGSVFNNATAQTQTNVLLAWELSQES